MNYRGILIFALTLALGGGSILAGGSTALAWGPPAGEMSDGPPGRHGGPHGERMSPAQRKEAMEKLKALRVYQLTQLLEMDEAQSTAFFSRLARHDDQMMEMLQGRVKAIRALKEAVSQQAAGQTIPPERFSKLIAELSAQESALESARAAFLADIGTILPPDQVARVILYQREFERRMRHYLQGGGRGGPPEGGSLEELGRPETLTAP